MKSVDRSGAVSSLEEEGALSVARQQEPRAEHQHMAKPNSVTPERQALVALSCGATSAGLRLPSRLRTKHQAQRQRNSDADRQRVPHRLPEIPLSSPAPRTSFPQLPSRSTPARRRRASVP